MKKIFIAAIVFLITSPIVFAQTKAGKKDTLRHASYYTCTMHDSVATKKPGNCPVCGMKLELSKKEQLKKDVTQTYSCPVHLDVYRHDAGKCPQCGKKLVLSAKEEMKAKVVKLYTCAMHPEIALDKEGKCPKCGTTLTEKKQDQ